MVKSAPAPATSTPLREFFYVLFRHKFMASLFFIAVMLATLVILSRTPATYTSEAKLFVQRGRENLQMDPTAMGQVIPIWKDWNNEINSEFEILTSRELIEEVANKIGVEKLLQKPERSRAGLLSWSGMATAAPHPSLGRGVEVIKRGLELQVVRKSDIFIIRYTTDQRLLAQQVVEELIDAYLHKHIDVHRNEGAYAFLDKQVELCQAQLEETESALRALKNEMGVRSLEETRNININRVNILRNQQERIDALLSASNAKIDVLNDILSKAKQETGKIRVRLRGTDYTDIESALLSEKINLASLQGESKSLESQIAGSSKTGINLTRTKLLEDRQDLIIGEIAASQAKAQVLASLRRKDTTGSDAGEQEFGLIDYDQIKAALWAEEVAVASQQAESKTVAGQLAEAEKEITGLNAFETRIQGLDRKRNDLERKYQRYLDSREQARINMALEEDKISNIKLVQAATEPLGANPSPKALMLASALFLALFGGIALAFTAERMDHTFRRSADVERELGVSVLGSIPQFKSKLIAPAKFTEHRNQPRPSLRMFGKTHLNVRPYFEPLTFNIMHSMELSLSGPTVIGLTCYGRNEGVSSVAANLAVTMARHANGDGALLIDGNPNTLSSHHSIELKEASGVWNINVDSRGEITVVEHHLYTEDDGRDSSESAIPHEEVLRLIRKHSCTFAVLDMPPLSQGITTLEMARALDYVVLVIEAEKICFEEARDAMRSLSDSGAKVLGAILNKRRYYVPNWLYRRL